MNLLMNLIIGNVLSIIDLYLIFYYFINKDLIYNHLNNIRMCFLSIIIYILLIISNTIINNYLVILTLFIICMLMMKYLIFPNNKL